MILETKLQPPSLKPKTLRRERLIRLVKNHLDRRLVVITSDAGYGKTTLLAQVIQETSLPCVFYHLDAGDSDWVVFASYLIHGIEGIEPELVSRTKGILENGEGRESYELLVGTLINELVEKRREELFFVIDDYHAIQENSGVPQALDYFISWMPETVHVILASRTNPNFPSLSGWRGKREVFELSRDELRFNEEELRALLVDVYKLSISEGEEQRLSEQTEGWITGIWLVLQAAKKDAETVKAALNGYLRARQPLFEYFANEVLSQETPEMQERLERSAILDVLTPDLSERIWEIKGAGRILEDIERRHLFISRVGSEEYKIHQLFRNYLLSRQKNLEKLKSLHRKAADYFREKGQAEQAIGHYIESECYVEAAELIIGIAQHLMERAQFGVLNNWLKRMPKEFSKNQAQLLLLRGKTSLKQGLFVEAEKDLAQAETLFIGAGDTTGEVKVWDTWGQLLWQKGDLIKALAYLNRARKHCPEEEETLMAKILKDIGLIHVVRGELRKAETVFGKSLKIAARRNDNFNMRIIYNNLGAIAYRQSKIVKSYGYIQNVLEAMGNNFYHKSGIFFGNAAFIALSLGYVEDARNYLGKGLSLCLPYDDHLSLESLYKAYGYLYLYEKKWKKAQNYLNKSIEKSTYLKHKANECNTLLYLGDLLRYQGDLDNAKSYLDRARSKCNDETSESNAFLLFHEGLLQLALGQFEQTLATIRVLKQLPNQLGEKSGRLLYYFRETLLCWVKGRRKEALKYFTHLIRDANRRGEGLMLVCEAGYFSGLKYLIKDLARTPRACYVSEKRYLTSLGILERESEFKEQVLRVKLFGSIEIQRREEALPLYQSVRKTTRVILAYFLLHPKDRVTWEGVAAWAWPNSKPSVAHQMFKNAMTEIRRCDPSLKRLIIFEEERYRCNPQIHLEVDVIEFQRVLDLALSETEEDKKLKYFEESVALYQSPLLPGIYYSWVDELRNVLEEKYTKALKQLVAINGRKGEFERCITYCLKYLNIDNLDDDINYSLIANLIQGGQKAKALDHYKLYRKILKKELQLEPSRRIKTLIGTSH